MSVCISSHGEFSSHELDGEFTCTLCGVLDEDALRAELAAIRGNRDELFNSWQSALAGLVEAKRKECSALCVDVEHDRDQINIALAEAQEFGRRMNVQLSNALHDRDDADENGEDLAGWVSEQLAELAEAVVRDEAAPAAVDRG